MNVITAGDAACPSDCSNYAAEAIRLDSIGIVGSAIIFYERAINCLRTLAHLDYLDYRDYELNKAYLERANAYQNRVKVLKSQQSPYIAPR